MYVSRALGKTWVAAYTYNESTICSLGLAFNGSRGAGKSWWVWENIHGDQSLLLCLSAPAGEQMGTGSTMNPLRFRIQNDSANL